MGGRGAPKAVPASPAAFLVLCLPGGVGGGTPTCFEACALHAAGAAAAEAAARPAGVDGGGSGGEGLVSVSSVGFEQLDFSADVDVVVGGNGAEGVSGGNAGNSPNRVVVIGRLRRVSNLSVAGGAFGRALARERGRCVRAGIDKTRGCGYTADCWLGAKAPTLDRLFSCLVGLSWVLPWRKILVSRGRRRSFVNKTSLLIFRWPCPSPRSALEAFQSFFRLLCVLRKHLTKTCDFCVIVPPHLRPWPGQTAGSAAGGGRIHHPAVPACSIYRTYASTADGPNEAVPAAGGVDG